MGVKVRCFSPLRCGLLRIFMLNVPDICRECVHIRSRANECALSKFAEVLKKATLKPLYHYIQKCRHLVYDATSSFPVLEE